MFTFRRAISALCLLVFFSALSWADDPQPKDAVDFVIDTFSKYPLVGLGERHGVAEMYSFYDALISDDRFQSKVDCIVLEIANAIHQPILNAYVNGEDVPISKLRRVWRDATNTLLQDGDAVYLNNLVTTVRDVNKNLKPEQRIRVLAGDPPLDWTTADKKAFYKALGSRDQHYAEIVKREILDKGKHGLLIMGRGHFSHVSPNPEYPLAAELIEDASPNSLFIVHLFAHSSARAKKVFASWPKPSICKIENTWIADLSSDVFMKEINGNKLTMGQTIDAILWLGPKNSFTSLVEPPFDAEYQEELKRRAEILK